MRVQAFTVQEAKTLQEFLLVALVGARKSRVQNLLRYKAIDVNNNVVTRGNHALQPGDCVRIHFDGSTAGTAVLDQGLKIIHEDADVFVLDKPAGLLTVATATERTRTAWSILQAALRKRNSRDRAFVVHRLDRETSGLLLMARREAVRDGLQANWEKVEKVYLAIVQGVPSPASGTVRNYLRETSTLLVVASLNPGPGARPAVTHYETVQRMGPYTLVRLKLETGRKNQIRIHMAGLGVPILGDDKYQGQRSPAGRLCLHAAELRFNQPRSGAPLHFTSSLPAELQDLVSGQPRP